MSDLRVVIADDEPLVRRGLRRLLADEPGVAVVGEARHGAEALTLIERHKPDLVFLDVAMPELDGLDVARELAGRRRPGIIFVTAFDRYAVEAFDVHAIDYVLKPFDETRLHVAIDRARARLGDRNPNDLAAQMAELLARLRPDRGRLERFVVRTGSRVVLVAVDEVDWIEAADNYVKLHAGGAKHVMRETLKGLERRLDPTRFVRIHRSAIVHLARVRELVALPSGDYAVILKTGARLTMSRRFKDAFERRVGRGA